MKILLRLSIWFLVILLPVIAIFSAMNLVSRAPDLYRYEFTAGNVSDEYEIGRSDSELAEFFSDFMWGKERQFSLQIAVNEQEQELFTIYEEIVARDVRAFLDFLGIITIAALLLVIISVGLLRRYDLREKIRWAYKVAWGWFAILWTILTSIFILPAFSIRLFSFLDVIPNSEDTLLLQLITVEFLKDWFLADVVLSIIVMTVIGFLLWSLSKPKLMFR